jgi:excisionase family DNA binding protein
MQKDQTIQLPHPLPKFLTVPEVAALLRVSLRTIYNMVSQRRIPFRKAGRQLLFDVKEIEEWTRSNAAER